MARVKRTRRKYTYKNPSYKPGAGLEKYRESRLQVSKLGEYGNKTSGRVQAYYKQKEKEYNEYVTEYYKTSRQLNKGKVKVGGKWFQSKQDKYSVDIRSDVYDISTYIRYTKKSGKIGAELARSQYALMDETQAEILLAKMQQYQEKILKDTGFDVNKLTVEQVRAKQMPREVWDELQKIAQDNDQTVSEFWFGSD